MPFPRSIICLLLFAALPAAAAPSPLPALQCEPLDLDGIAEATETAAVNGDDGAVFEFLYALRHSDGAFAWSLCAAFPRILSRQQPMTIEQATLIGDDIVARMTTCIDQEVLRDAASSRLTASLRSIDFRDDPRRKIRDALVYALEHPDPDWP